MKGNDIEMKRTHSIDTGPEILDESPWDVLLSLRCSSDTVGALPARCRLVVSVSIIAARHDEQDPARAFQCYRKRDIKIN